MKIYIFRTLCHVQDSWCTKKGESHVQATEIEFLRGIKRHNLHVQVYITEMRWELSMFCVLDNVMGSIDNWREHIKWVNTGTQGLPYIPPCRITM
jgi:hypothetical protein